MIDVDLAGSDQENHNESTSVLNNSLQSFEPEGLRAQGILRNTLHFGSINEEKDRDRRSSETLGVQSCEIIEESREELEDTSQQSPLPKRSDVVAEQPDRSDSPRCESSMMKIPSESVSLLQEPEILESLKEQKSSAGSIVDQCDFPSVSNGSPNFIEVVENEISPQKNSPIKDQFDYVAFVNSDNPVLEKSGAQISPIPTVSDGPVIPQQGISNLISDSPKSDKLMSQIIPEECSLESIERAHIKSSPVENTSIPVEILPMELPKKKRIRKKSKKQIEREDEDLDTGEASRSGVVAEPPKKKKKAKRPPKDKSSSPSTSNKTSQVEKASSKGSPIPVKSTKRRVKLSEKGLSTSEPGTWSHAASSMPGVPANSSVIASERPDEPDLPSKPLPSAIGGETKNTNQTSSSITKEKPNYRKTKEEKLKLLVWLQEFLKQVPEQFQGLRRIAQLAGRTHEKLFRKRVKEVWNSTCNDEIRGLISDSKSAFSQLFDLCLDEPAQPPSIEEPPEDDRQSKSEQRSREQETPKKRRRVTKSKAKSKKARTPSIETTPEVSLSTKDKRKATKLRKKKPRLEGPSVDSLPEITPQMLGKRITRGRTGKVQEDKNKPTPDQEWENQGKHSQKKKSDYSQSSSRNHFEVKFDHVAIPEDRANELIGELLQAGLQYNQSTHPASAPDPKPVTKGGKYGKRGRPSNSFKRKMAMKELADNDNSTTPKSVADDEMSSDEMRQIVPTDKLSGKLKHRRTKLRRKPESCSSIDSDKSRSKTKKRDSAEEEFVVAASKPKPPKKASQKDRESSLSSKKPDKITSSSKLASGSQSLGKRGRPSKAKLAELNFESL